MAWNDIDLDKKLRDLVRPLYPHFTKCDMGNLLKAMYIQRLFIPERFPEKILNEFVRSKGFTDWIKSEDSLDHVEIKFGAFLENLAQSRVAHNGTHGSWKESAFVAPSKAMSLVSKSFRSISSSARSSMLYCKFDVILHAMFISNSAISEVVIDNFTSYIRQEFVEQISKHFYQYSEQHVMDYVDQCMSVMKRFSIEESNVGLNSIDFAKAFVFELYQCLKSAFFACLSSSINNPESCSLSQALQKIMKSVCYLGLLLWSDLIRPAARVDLDCIQVPLNVNDIRFDESVSHMKISTTPSSSTSIWRLFWKDHQLHCLHWQNRKQISLEESWNAVHNRQEILSFLEYSSYFIDYTPSCSLLLSLRPSFRAPFTKFLSDNQQFALHSRFISVEKLLMIQDQTTLNVEVDLPLSRVESLLSISRYYCRHSRRLDYEPNTSMVSSTSCHQKQINQEMDVDVDSPVSNDTTSSSELMKALFGAIPTQWMNASLSHLLTPYLTSDGRQEKVPTWLMVFLQAFQNRQLHWEILDTLGFYIEILLASTNIVCSVFGALTIDVPVSQISQVIRLGYLEDLMEIMRRVDNKSIAVDLLHLWISEAKAIGLFLPEYFAKIPYRWALFAVEFQVFSYFTLLIQEPETVESLDDHHEVEESDSRETGTAKRMSMGGIAMLLDLAESEDIGVIDNEGVLYKEGTSAGFIYECLMVALIRSNRYLEAIDIGRRYFDRLKEFLRSSASLLSLTSRVLVLLHSMMSICDHALLLQVRVEMLTTLSLVHCAMDSMEEETLDKIWSLLMAQGNIGEAFSLYHAIDRMMDQHAHLCGTTQVDFAFPAARYFAMHYPMAQKEWLSQLAEQLVAVCSNQTNFQESDLPVMACLGKIVDVSHNANEKSVTMVVDEEYDRKPWTRYESMSSMARWGALGELWMALDHKDTNWKYQQAFLPFFAQHIATYSLTIPFALNSLVGAVESPYSSNGTYHGDLNRSIVDLLQRGKIVAAAEMACFVMSVQQARSKTTRNGLYLTPQTQSFINQAFGKIMIPTIWDSLSLQEQQTVRFSHQRFQAMLNRAFHS